MMKIKNNSRTCFVTGVAAMIAFPCFAQDAATTEKAKAAAETIFKNPRLQEIISNVKENPDSALKDVSSMARQQLGQMQGSTNGGVPATRSQLPAVTTPPPVPVPAAKIPAAPATATATPPAATPAPVANSAPQANMIPEPIARDERPSNAPPRPAGLPPAPAQTQIQNGAVPPPRPLVPHYDKSGTGIAPKSKQSSSDMMEITSDESVMDEGSNILTFTGHVVVQSPDFNLTGDKLVIYLNEEKPEGAPAGPEDDAPFRRAIATGGMVEIERVGEGGEIQIAKSRKAEYDALTKDMVLSGGPPTLQSGQTFVNPSAQDARIILTGDKKHIVDAGSGRSTIRVPMKGGSSLKNIGPGGSVDDISNRRN